MAASPRRAVTCGCNTVHFPAWMVATNAFSRDACWVTAVGSGSAADDDSEGRASTACFGFGGGQVHLLSLIQSFIFGMGMCFRNTRECLFKGVNPSASFTVDCSGGFQRPNSENEPSADENNVVANSRAPLSISGPPPSGRAAVAGLLTNHLLSLGLMKP